MPRFAAAVGPLLRAAARACLDQGATVARATAPSASASLGAIARAAAATPPAAATPAAAALPPLWRRAALAAPGPFGGSSILSAAAAAAAARRPPPLSPLRPHHPQNRSYATDFARKQAANPGLKFWKPTSPGQRGRVTVRRDGIWKGKPMRTLVKGTKTTGGRNHDGRITCRHRGGGHKRKLREVDFLRTAATGRAGVKGTVQRIEYDPARSAYLALVRYDQSATGAKNKGGGGSGRSAATAAKPLSPPPKEYGYILAPQGLSAGDVVVSAPAWAGASGTSSSNTAADATTTTPAADSADTSTTTTPVPIKPGNRLALADIPVGIPIHAIELRPGEGGQLCRAAGVSAVIANKQPRRAVVRLPSGEQRLLPLACRATVGTVSNPQHKNRRLGKAGANRHRGIRPTVRGIAMNPVDHPHGGRTNGGRPSVSPWARPAKGGRTRKSGKASDRVILVTRRQASRRGKD
jgi:large subunit ribosomal protein L2